MPFEMKAGDTRNVFITITDKAGTPIDLTSATSIRWWASRGDATTFSRTPTLMKTIDAGIDEVSLLDGQIVIRIRAIDSRELNGSYYHEVEVIDAAGNVSTPIADTFTVKRDLIR